MKLLFDQNLSFRLCEAISDIFPNSIHVRHVGLETADDRAIWHFAARHDYTIVSQDADFAEMAFLRGSPPKVIWVRAGNRPWRELSALFRDHAGMIAAFEEGDAACLEIH